MLRLRSWTGALAGGFLMFAAAHADPATAQARGRLEVTPYAGMMLPADLVSGPLGTRIGLAVGPVYGGQLGVALAPGVALVGHVGHTTADVEAGVPVVGGVSFGSSEAWLLDGALQLSLPGSGGVGSLRPFLQLGGGAIRREITVGPVTVRSTAPSLSAGLGLDVSLGSGVAVRLLARDHVGKFDFEDALLFDPGQDTMHNVALSGGLKVSF
jgi:hypothetical protein